MEKAKPKRPKTNQKKKEKDFNNVNEVQAQLLAELSAEDVKQGRSTFLSPLSIYACVLLLTEGLSGQSRKECTIFLDALKIKGKLLSQRLALDFKKLLNSKSPAFTMANSIWVNKALKLVTRYKNRVQEQHNALVKNIPINNDGLAQINEWVSKTTKGLIDSILDELTSDTVMVIINAIYFKGTWKTVFKASNTDPRDFHLSAEEGDTVEVQMMNQTLKTKYAETKLNRLVVLPFNEDNIQFVACIPKDETNFDPLSTFKATNIQKALKANVSKKVCLSMPKFKFERSFDVKTLLQKLGLSNIFSTDENDDFKGIVQGGDAYVSDVIQKSIIELDEKGAKAAAVTAMVLKTKSAPRPDEIIYLNLNRPFAFFLVDGHSKLILFAGVYRGPK